MLCTDALLAGTLRQRSQLISSTELGFTMSLIHRLTQIKLDERLWKFGNFSSQKTTTR